MSERVNCNVYCKMVVCVLGMTDSNSGPHNVDI
jgi:hypothetical protein